MSCPCEECISYAICYNSENINCEELYHYVCVVDINHGFVRYNKYSLIVLLDVFSRYLANSSHGDSHKLHLVSDIKEVRGLLYEEYA